MNECRACAVRSVWWLGVKAAAAGPDQDLSLLLACVVQLSAVAAVLGTVASSDLHQLPTLNHPPSPRHHRSATLGAAVFCDSGASQNRRTHFEVTLYNCERENGPVTAVSVIAADYRNTLCVRRTETNV